MSRRKAAPKRKILPDPKYKSEVVSKFINCVMVNGKKSIAEKMVYGAFDILASKGKFKAKNDESEGDGEGSRVSGGNAGAVLDLFDQVLDNVRPTVEVRSRRVGGATYQIPVEVRADRAMALAMRWLIQMARARSEKGSVKRLAGEMLDALEGRGQAVKKREDTHRMAKANQAFAHYRW
ncbi:MAG: 30S ribosomal protein S7 [Legionellales bacterium]|nr:30S ribosomal protein S7 [Legionellales bacterium]